MHISTTAGLLACASVAHAFSNSSPFVLFSTAELPPISDDIQLQISDRVLTSAKELLAACPTERYVLISQPNVHASDIRDGTRTCRMPNLCQAVESDRTRGIFSVAEVIGQIQSQPLVDYIRDACATVGRPARVDELQLERLPSLRDVTKRAGLLADNDHELGRLVETLDDDYTVLFFSDPSEFKTYEPEFLEPVHMDLKRHSEPVLRSRASNDSLAGLPLFEKYQFFTPGIFMGLVFLVVALSILSVGINALADLKVSYGAFDKEMGPGAQKKQM